MEEGIKLERLLREEGYRKPVCCSKCGKLLTYKGVGEYKCDACGFTEYDDYGLVRAYLEKNPGATMVQVETATKVPKKTLNAFVREGKFVISRGGRLEGIDE